MAEEVPVSDVLCEAMEYLSKLGTNLRARSDNLKEKRIRKDKLRNSHAVQKAADKVLLICELSKKSLENVESGVRKVLSLVSQSQSNFNLRSHRTSKDGDVYQYFTHGSRKLRVSKKVPLKHFMSVKVMARSMPPMMQDKYPVYYNCVLYRRRKKHDMAGEFEKKLDSGSDDDVSPLHTNPMKKRSDSFSRCESENSNNACSSNKEYTMKDCQTERNSSESEFQSRKKDEKLIEILNDDPENSNYQSKIDKDVEYAENGFAASKINHNPKNTTNDDIKEENMNDDKLNDNNHHQKDSSHVSLSNNPLNNQAINNEETDIIQGSSSNCSILLEKNKEICSDNVEKYPSCFQNENQVEIDKEINEADKVADFVESDHEPSPNILGKSSIKDKVKKYIGGVNKGTSKKKYRHIRVIDDESDSSESCKDVKNDKKNETLITKSSCDDKCSTANDNDDNQKVHSEKPLLKCVSITKLLKPEVLNVSQKKSLPKEITKTCEDEKNKTYETDKKYWASKREVKNFQAKKCSVTLNRLPKITITFLHMYKLKRITHSNNVICELPKEKNVANNICPHEADLPNEVQNKTSKSNDSAEKKVSNAADTDINTLKQALLDESDTDGQENEDNITELHENQACVSLCKDSNKSDNQFKGFDKSDIENASFEMRKHNAQNNIKVNDKDAIQQNDIEVSETLQTTGNSSSLGLQNENVEEIKNALLYETDSDEILNERIKSTEHNQKQSNDKVIESSGTSSSHSKSENIISTKSVKAHSGKEITPTKEDDKRRSAKTSSSDEGASNQKKKKYSKSPKSKKTYAASSRAKKMLLRYSSSSETDDDNLNSVLKVVKDQILKRISSDEENFSLKVSKRKLSSSSSSKDDILKGRHKKLKKRKISLQSESKKCDESTDNSDSCSKKMGRSRAKPSGSSQNSESQEASNKDIDGLTNLSSLMKNRRRRESAMSTDTSVNSKRKNKAMAKAPIISEENLLKAEDSSSEIASGGESDGIEEDLPPVSALNGSGIDHLAKDDLLGESDTSISHNEKEEESKNESDEDHHVKSKRRKANAISSDSEAGSSRKKDRNVKLSDFEDSEDESSEPKNKSKRQKDPDSDASGNSSSNDGSKKKRRRIKPVNDSDASGSDTENEGRNKHGRKNIRKVMSKNQLEEATKKAARQEKERIARIAERQKLYNNLEFDESGKPDEVVLEKVILDFDPETKEPLIQVDRGLVKKLKPHQANGIKFMWDACFESVKRIKKDKGSGCILAHCMGLGKTLQVVSLTHTLLTHSELTTVNRVLVVCPLSTVLNWVNEFKMWLKHSETEYDVDVYELSRYKQNSERAFQLQQWFVNGGVCVLGYEMFRNLSADNTKKFKKKMLKNFQEALVEPGPDLVVCDEGHLLKNEKTSLSQSMNRVRTLRRIVLTGTPLQNNLKEYYCMVQFVKPNLLGKYNEYLNRFVNPITNGQYTDSTEHDIRIMKRRSHVLHKMLDGAVQRRDYGVLAPFLPPKHEYVLFITLSEVQIKLYQFYLDNYSRRPLAGKSSGFLFPDFQSLQRIWTHPLVLKYNSERYEIMQQKKREREEEDDSEGSLADFIDDESTPDESSSEESSDDMSDVSDDSRKKSKKKKSQKKGKGKDSKISTRRGTRSNPVEVNEDSVAEVVELKAENPTEWWIKLVTEDELEDMRNSHKLILLFEILRQCEAIGDKLLVFSQSLYSLDLIEHFLGKVDEATQEGRIDDKLGGHVGSWSPGVDYFRLDGSTSCENRSIWCKNFNREDNPRARLFLISTRAGGLGINLVAANRVVIFDVSWNPSHDVQSIFRVYRFGQKKPCYIYRFLAMGTMEEKIYERQVTKQAISKRVIDEQQIDRHYAENDLAELYKFEPRPPTPRPLPPLPRDRLFAEMLREHEPQIYKYHEHDSLLENKEEETLSEEERKAAWEDFENEKNRPPPAPFPSAWPTHNGMVPGLLAQQQQLAYAALAAMLRKDMPNINDNQIRDMLPLIYNANPALMQKMSEIYKYAPPGGMMNPGMMNPVMNAGGGGSLGGASGLQYEPPWQRQHQQQQQMRLQQLAQHQNLGAKYYAGGLGSRDPVAMALQQQRAREIMAGEQRAARPRGRPPHSRAPPPDVVTLDSD